MKKKSMKELLINEIEQIDIKMSERVKNTKIVKVEKNSIRFTKFLTFKFVFVMSFIIIALSCILYCLDKNNSTTYITSYILEINPSICVTADNEDNVISIYPLNEDANLILSDMSLNNISGEKLSDCLSKIIKVISDEGIFDNYENTIKLYAINDNEKICSKKLDEFEGFIKKELNSLGVKDVPFEKHEMNMFDFKEKLGVDDGFDNLNQMKNFLEDKDFNRKTNNEENQNFDNPEKEYPNENFNEMDKSDREKPFR
ncbi:MAG: hypothetical protein IJW82_00620 [Clostridia bacterium]|nr:hypothetical protein [Clostridia bacterium]